MSDIKLVSSLNFTGSIYIFFYKIKYLYSLMSVKYLYSLMDLDDVNQGKVCSFIKLYM